MVAELSISNGVPVIYMPLIIILCVSATKDFFEDLKRKKSDLEENTRMIKQAPGKFLQWKDIRVGQIIKVNQDEYVPCDLIFICSSNHRGTLARVPTNHM